MRGGKRAIVALVAVVITASALWYNNRSVAPKKATWEDVVAEAKRGGYQLIRTDELWEHYRNDPQSLLLVDTRQEWEYRTGHIKGALNFPMEPTWMSRWLKRGDLERVIGPKKNRFIVFY